MTILEFKNIPSTIKILSEIGDPVPPYITKDKIDIKDDSDYGDYSFTFKDQFDNSIKVCFICTDINNQSFEVEFMVNGNSVKALDTNISHYFKILSTVIEVINKFIEIYSPNTLLIDGIGVNQEKYSQKNKIYIAYAKNLIDDGEYSIGTLPKGFALQKKKNNLEEFYNKISR